MAVMKFMGHKSEKAVRGFLRTDSAKEEGLGVAYIISPVDHDQQVEARSMNEAYLKMMGGTYTRTIKDENGDLIEEAIKYEPNHPERFPVDQNIFDYQNRNPDLFEINKKRKATDSEQQYGHFVIYLGHLKSEEEILKAQKVIAKSFSYRDFSYQTGGGDARIKDKIFKNSDAGCLVSPVHYQEGVGPHVHVIVYGRSINHGVYEYNKDGDLVQKTFTVTKKDPETGLEESKAFFNNKKQVSVLEMTETTFYNKLFNQLNSEFEKAGLSPLKSLDPKAAEREKGVSEVVQQYLDEYGFASTEKINNRVNQLEEESKKDVLISPAHDINENVRNIITEELKETNEAKSNIQKSHDFNRLVSGVLADHYKTIHLLETAKQISEVSMITEGKLIDANNNIRDLKDEVRSALEINESLINDIANKNTIILEKDEKIAAVEEELATSNEACDLLTESLAEEEKKYTKLNSDFITLDKEYTEYQIKVAEDLIILKDSHQEEIENLKSEHVDNITDLTDAYEVKLTEKDDHYKAIVDAKDKEIAERVEIITKRDEEINGFKSDIEELKEKLNNEITSKNAIQELLDKANLDLTAISKKYNIVLSDNSKLKEEKANISAHNEKLEKDLKKSKEENIELNDNNNKLAETNEELKTNLETAVNHMSLIAETFNMSEEEKKDFSNSIIKEVSGLSEEKSTLEEDFEALRKYLKQKHKLDIDNILDDIKNEGKGSPKPKI